ncbi:MAG: hypothetical protein Q4D99_02190 [Bacillota bacterium]|nr:hypothetical protein [Bacillota bacterium]
MTREELDRLTLDEMCDRVMNATDISNQEWHDIHRWILDYLKTNPPEKEQRKIYPLGILEVVSMMID